MKAILFSILTVNLLLLPGWSQAGGTGDTVVIELSNKSKIVIYTADRTELKNIEHYDINQMIKDLNDALNSKEIQKVELQDESGKKYLKDTTIIIGEGTAKTRIKIGNLEVLIDADEWSDLEEEFDEDLPTEKYSHEEKRHHRTENTFNVELGMSNWLENGTFPDASNQPYTLKPWGSWILSVNSVNRTWVGGPLFLEWGGGVSRYSWKLENPDYAITKGSERVEFTERTDVSAIKSRLATTYLNVTVVPMLEFSRGTKKVNHTERGSITLRTSERQGFRLGAGGYVGYRMGGQSKFVYKDDEKRKDKIQGNFFMENIRYGIRVQLGYDDLDIFAMYDLNEVFAAGRGPDGSPGLNAISFGIVL